MSTQCHDMISLCYKALSSEQPSNITVSQRHLMVSELLLLTCSPSVSHIGGSQRIVFILHREGKTLCLHFY